jgi:hypothetical protein
VTRRERFVISIIAAPVALGLLFLTVRRLLAGPILPDFFLYRGAAQIGLTYGWSRIYDFDVQRAVFNTYAQPGTTFEPFWNTPIAAVLMIPFAALPAPAGYALWVAILVSAWVSAVWLLAPGDGIERAIHLLLSAALFPVVFGIFEGQVDALLALGLAGAGRLLLSRRDGPAGLVLALAIAIKPHPLLFVPVALLFAGRFRTVVAWLATSATLALGSVALIGPHGVSSVIADLMVARAYGQSGYTLPSLLPGPAGWGLAAGTIAISLIVARRARSHPLLVVAVGVVTSLAVSPYLFIQDVALLLPAGWAALRADPTRKQLALQCAIYVGAESALALGVLLVAGELLWLASLLASPVTKSGPRIPMSPGLVPLPAAPAIPRSEADCEPHER